MNAKPEPFYVTTAIDYPNGVPHMGHAFEKSLADFYARWYRSRGRDTYFLTGLDEHGQKIQEAAEAARLSPQAFVDEKSRAFLSLCDKLLISNDDFVRTSEKRHYRFANEIYNKVLAKGDIYLGQYEGDYCVSCESFYTESQLVNGKCPIHGRRPERIKEESYFFRLSKYRDWIREHIKAHPEFIYPETRRNETLSRLEEQIWDLSISRSGFDWGIPLPNDPKHVLYVWFDALSNYISALKEPRDIYERYWPADMHVIGKDIIWFHTVIWPCMLYSAELPLPRQVYVHGFILDGEGHKMAKHLGNVVDPIDIASRYGAEVLRYYFLRAIGGGQDGKFSEKELVERYHSELGNDLGNLVMRVAKLVEDKLGGKAEAGNASADLDPTPVFEEYARFLEVRDHNRALDALWAFIRKTNAYLNERAPWKETDEAAIQNVLYNALEALRGITYLLAPVMPGTAASIARQIGSPLESGALAAFGSGKFSVTRESALFPRIETEKDRTEAAKARSGKAKGGGKAKGSKGQAEVEPFAKLDIRVGFIEEVREHPDADALWVFTMLMSEKDDESEPERRTICAGLREHLTKDELLGRRVAVLANLKTAKLRGVESQGMVLATDTRDGRVVPVDPGKAPIGEAVTIESIKSRPKSKLSSKDLERAPLSMQGGVVVCEGKELRTSAGPVRCDAEDGAVVR